MKITLRRSVEVESYEVQMTIFEEEDKRPEIIPLLKAVGEANEEGVDVVEYLQTKIFFDLPQTFIRNVLEELYLMEFIDEEDTLTERGSETIKTKEVMVPRTGPYRVNVVDDPLINQVVLTCDPLKASLRKEIYNSTNESGRVITIPSYLKNTIGRRIKTVETETRMIDIKEISERASVGRQLGRVDVELQFTNYWELKIRFRKMTRRIDLPETFNGDLLIDQLLKMISDQADLSGWRIPLNPNSLKISELKRFKKNFSLNNIMIERLGHFSRTIFEDIEIYPENEEAAYQWAKNLFIEELSEYMFGNKYRKTWEELFNTYPNFDEYTIPQPTLEDLWNSNPFGSHKYWLLRAGTDMRLEEVIKE